jgi:hypothetical protein
MDEVVTWDFDESIPSGRFETGDDAVKICM